MQLLSEQEQEHLDHVAGCASEFQNCLSEARSDLSRHNYREAQRISRALELKNYVVVRESTYYCRATDGIAGVLASFAGAFVDRAAAEAAAAAIVEDSQGEDSAHVLPRLPNPAPKFVPPPADDDDVPF